MKKFVAQSLLASLGCLAACSGDDGNANSDAGEIDADTEADAQTSKSLTIGFRAEVGGEAFACEDKGAAKVFTGIGTGADSVTFKDFRLYISNIRLVDGEGAETPVTLVNDEQFQLQTESDGHVALLDFEDGTQNCSAVGNAPTHTEVTGTVEPGNYTGIVFEVGVPFALNHLDVNAVSTAPPLNIGALYWAWALGHKFARIDIDLDEVGGDDVFNFHLGSTMCTSEGPMDPPAAECARPNRVTVRLDEFDVDVDTIVIDAAEIFADNDVAVNTADTTPGCQTFPADSVDCTPLFPNLGLDFQTGACTDGCAGQTVFSIAK